VAYPQRVAMLKRNIAATALGSSWVAMLSVLIIPVQIRVLGVEAYGLIAFLASLQVLASIFDLGLSPTITQQVTRDGTTGLRRSGELVGSLALVYWPIGLLLGAALFLESDWLAIHWLHLGRLPVSTAVTAIRLAAVTLALRWPVSFYAGVIAGRQRFDFLNELKAAVATIAIAGGAAIILLSGSLLAYMAWMLAAAALEVAGYVILASRLIPGTVFRPDLVPHAIRTVARFAAGINGINLLAMVLTQSDRLLISKLLTIQSLGYYSLAYNIVYGLTLIPAVVTSVLYPAFAASHAGDRPTELYERYQKAAQLLMYVYNLPIWMAVFFGDTILATFTSSGAVEHVAPVLSVLALAFLVNAMVILAYTASIGTGNTSVPLRVNLVAVPLYLPLMALLTVRWGGIGAATAFLALNVYYLPTLFRIAHHRILGGSAVLALIRNVLPFVGTGVISFGSMRLVYLWNGVLPRGTQPGLALAALASIPYSILGFAFLGASLRTDVAASVRAVRQRFTAAPSARG